jgi:CheY-like chemotaxis protein
MPPSCDRCGAEALLLSTVTRLPLCADCASLELTTTRSQAAPAQEVLVVESSEPFGCVLRRQLEHDGRHVTVADSAASALIQMRRQPPDVILCEQQLGGAMSGVELLEVARVLYPAARRVLYSACALPEAERMRARGVAHVLHDTGATVECLVGAITA